MFKEILEFVSLLFKETKHIISFKYMYSSEYVERLLMRIEELESATSLSQAPIVMQQSLIDDETEMDIYESVLYLIDEFMEQSPNSISEEYFHDFLEYEIYELITAPFEYDDISDEDDDIIREIIQLAIDDYFDVLVPRRSEKIDEKRQFDVSKIDEKRQFDVSKIAGKIAALRKIPQAPQKTKIWYLDRHNLLTASIIYKIFESEATRNQLIYEKCKPLDAAAMQKRDEMGGLVNTNSPLHRGHKYEPLTRMIYSNRNSNCEIEEFGCIKHSQYPFLGASPDGVVVSGTNTGRLVEIKNITNREIDGEPKTEYWIQMQIQMEVLDLDECDFVETRFLEISEAEYSEAEHTSRGTIIEKWSEESIKYEYLIGRKPTPEEIPPINARVIYWKLDQYSCVLVKRNRDWFEYAIEAIKETWETIERERISGYEHRAPMSRRVSATTHVPICVIKLENE